MWSLVAGRAGAAVVGCTKTPGVTGAGVPAMAPGRSCIASGGSTDLPCKAAIRSTFETSPLLPVVASQRIATAPGVALRCCLLLRGRFADLLSETHW